MDEVHHCIIAAFVGWILISPKNTVLYDHVAKYFTGEKFFRVAYRRLKVFFS